MDAIVKHDALPNIAELVGHIEGYTGHDLTYAEVRDKQIAAMNERLQQRREDIKLVAFRAEEAGIDEITCLEDVVPLLLPHTAYKSYPEKFLMDEQWERLTKWLGLGSGAFASSPVRLSPGKRCPGRTRPVDASRRSRRRS